MTNHTPGPWILSKFTVKAGGIRIRQDSGPEGASVNSQMQNMAIKEANARLIAAAPELLDALKAADVALDDAYNRLEMDGGNEWCMRRIQKVAEVVRAAIAKAEGSAE